MSNPGSVLFHFALESLPQAALSTQAKVYRALAELSADRVQRTKLSAEAEACERMLADQAAQALRHRQLVLDFKRRAS